MARSVKEWVGKDDDEPVPRRVKARVFLRFGGVCGICGVKIRVKVWVCDHRIALCNAGRNAESNLWPIHEACDRKVKTPADVALKAHDARVRNKHLGLTRPKRSIGYRRFNGTAVKPRWGE